MNSRPFVIVGATAGSLTLANELARREESVLVLASHAIASRVPASLSEVWILPEGGVERSERSVGRSIARLPGELSRAADGGLQAREAAVAEVVSVRRWLGELRERALELGVRFAETMPADARGVLRPRSPAVPERLLVRLSGGAGAAGRPAWRRIEGADGSCVTVVAGARGATAVLAGATGLRRGAALGRVVRDIAGVDPGLVSRGIRGVRVIAEGLPMSPAVLAERASEAAERILAESSGYSASADIAALGNV